MRDDIQACDRAFVALEGSAWNGKNLRNWVCLSLVTARAMTYRGEKVL